MGLRTVLLTVATLLIFGGVALAQQEEGEATKSTGYGLQMGDGSLTPADFRAADPSRAKASYRRFYTKFFDLRLKLKKDRANYQVWVNIITRDAIKRRIQWEIDEYNITDPEQIQQIIDYYEPVTPKWGEVVLNVNVMAPRMNTRVFQDFLDDLGNHIYLAYGHWGQQQKLNQLWNRTEIDYQPIPQEKLRWGKYALDPAASYVRGITPEVGEPVWSLTTKTYSITLKFKVDQQTVDDMLSFIQRDRDVKLWIVISDPFYYVRRELKGWQKASVLYQLSPALLTGWKQVGQYLPSKQPVTTSGKYKPERDYESKHRNPLMP